MTASLRISFSLIIALLVAACTQSGLSNLPSSDRTSSSQPSPGSVPEWQAKHLAHAACPQVPGAPTCLVLLADSRVTPLCAPITGACGFTPADLRERYELTPYLRRGSETKVAVIEEGDSADAASDLATYRSEFHLGPADFVKYNQLGQKRDYPESCENFSWCIETELDIEMVSVSCPKCTIELVESDGTISGMEKAETAAVARGATIISNSWTCYISWTCTDRKLPDYFKASGVVYLASSGDLGHNYIGAPAALRTVVAVGGTQLTKDGSRYSEFLWDSAGGGCANPYNVGKPGIKKPTWQLHDSMCRFRNVADVSAQAGCQPGVAEYAGKYGGWFGVCGTSVAAPLVAGMFAIAGNAASQDAGKTFWENLHHKHLYDVCGRFCLLRTYSYGGGWGSPKGLRAL